MDAVLIKQLTKPDSALLELRYNNTRFFAASMYFDITKEIERELDEIEEIIEFTKGTGLVSNSRVTAWHDSQTIQRGKILEEYNISKNSSYNG
jgi:hypothetical protein